MELVDWLMEPRVTAIPFADPEWRIEGWELGIRF